MSKSKKDVQPHWRPNFVNTASLPDIKAVRTGFIINFVSVVLMLLTGFYLVQREYRAYALSNTIDELEQRIRIGEPDDALSLKLSRKFRDQAAHIAELEQFYTSPALAHQLVKGLSEMRPKELIFKRISVAERLVQSDKKEFVSFTINITGEVRSLTVLDEFKGALASGDLLKFSGYELSIDEALQGRDATTGIFPYTLEITFTPAPEEKSEGEETEA